MHFAFSADQLELRLRVRRRAGTRIPAERAAGGSNRRRRAQRTLLAGARWSALSALGVPGMLVPENKGGGGLSDVDLVGILEEAGCSALPEPLLETAALAAPMLAALLPAPPAAAALRVLLAQHAPVAVGGIEVGVAGPLSPTTVSADGTLRTPRVVGARDAGVYLLACRDPDSGWQLHAVPSRACTVDAAPTRDRTRDLSTVHWPLSSDTLVAFGIAADASVGLIADRAAAGSAALLVGLADRMIAISADHARRHHASGQDIGRLHAARHALASARVQLELARPAAYRAAWSLATAQPTVSFDASMAKAMASDAAEGAARAALHAHGAVGHTLDGDLHVYMARTWALCGSWGDAATHRQLLLAQVGRAGRAVQTTSDFRQ